MKIRTHVSGWAASGLNVHSRRSGAWSGDVGSANTWAIGMPRTFTSNPTACSFAARISASRGSVPPSSSE